MTYARKSLVSLSDTPYYHVVARCVRRAWLCGYDEYAARDYSHRKAWVLHRLAALTQVFAIDVCAYAVMSNHHHLVVHVDRSAARHWSSEEVAAERDAFGRAIGSQAHLQLHARTLGQHGVRGMRHATRLYAR